MKNVPVSAVQFDSKRGQSGYTLTELVVVTVILCVAAAIVIPSGNPSIDTRVELTANEFASAMRFARSESLRTGQPHGFRFLASENRIRVFTVDSSSTPWTLIWDVNDPVDKQLYDVLLPDSLAAAADPIVPSPDFRGSCTQPSAIYFDAQGTPWCLEPENVLLNSYRLDFAVGSSAAAVVLDGVSGRVTVQ